jgi:hypothetical protein
MWFPLKRADEANALHVIHLLREIKMSVDALNSAISKLSTDVNSLIAQNAASVPQSQVDAATAAVSAIDATVSALLPPAPAPAS